jgi:hypothetical protein|nr:hypothetical protein [uncultured bacterium]
MTRRDLEIMMSDTLVKITLSGGPSELATVDRSVPAAELGRTLKIRYRAGHEHFVHDGEYQKVDGHEVAVFRWTYRTKIAE